MSVEEVQDRGKCVLCDEMISKRQMTRHLKKCVAKTAAGGGKKTKLFHLVIEGKYSPEYWLHIEIPGTMTLVDIDAFLRKIWLECCGHMSCFTIYGGRFASHPMDEDEMFGFGDMHESSMKQKISKVLEDKSKFAHEYDYGSTTELKLRVVGIRDANIKSAKITLLARNEPPEWECVKCSKPATQVHALGLGADCESVFCDKCMHKEEDEEMFLPLVNSPRTGVCAYC